MESFKELLTKYEISFVSLVPESLLCTICNRVLIDAYYGACGCRFCSECIRSYLGTNERKCPGGRDEFCNSILLCWRENVLADVAANRDVALLIAKCPHKYCTYTCPLMRMTEHVPTCERLSVNCVFFDIGCHNNDLWNESMKQHVGEGIVEHMRLLLDFVKNFENETRLRLAEIDGQLVRKLNDLLKVQEDSFRQFLIDSLSQQDLEIHRLRCEIESIRSEQIATDTANNIAIERFKTELSDVKKLTQQNSTKTTELELKMENFINNKTISKDTNPCSSLEDIKAVDAMNLYLEDLDFFSSSDGCVVDKDTDDDDEDNDDVDDEDAGSSSLITNYFERYSSHTQLPHASNIRSLRGKMSKTGNFGSPQSSISSSNTVRGSHINRRNLGRVPGNRGGRMGLSSGNVGGRGRPYVRGGLFMGRGRNAGMRRGHRWHGPGQMSKTPEQKKEELDAELDAYMQGD